ncbi:MAG: DUF692 domain-containing protein [Gammaproteobacteria bacterium]|nr:DUF692 domain-containing protein [Gammaproteobacteria bacterium]
MASPLTATPRVTSVTGASQTIPAAAGIGLRAEHYHALLQTRPAIGWLEVHSENYFGEGSLPLTWLERLREHYPLSLHGVGLSLGSVDPLDLEHLRQLKQLIERVQPALVSEHAAWCSVDGRHLHDLLPLPYTEEALNHLVNRIQQAQDFLGRPLLIENLSSYVQYTHSTMPEWEFMPELARRSGCRLLLDINNVYVSAVNHHFDARQYLAAIPAALVDEVHLAGHTRRVIDGVPFLIDTHDQRVSDEVWALYRFAMPRLASVPVLIEWDAALPALEVLLSEAEHAQSIMESDHAVTA